MKKSELSELLHAIDGLAVGEGEAFLIEKGQYPKAAYWDSVWEDAMASGDDYEEVVTYQISFASLRPRDPKLLELKRRLNEAGQHPVIYHEYVAGEGAPAYFHSYFSLAVEETIT